MADTPEVPSRNIYQRLLAVAGEVEYIQKLKSVSTGGEGSYKAVTHDQVTGTLRGAFLKHGVVVYPVLVESRTVPTGAKTKAGADHVRFEAVYDVHFVNADNPTYVLGGVEVRQDEVVVRVPAHGVDSGDKAPGKTISYAVKYAMLKILMIETGENEESRFGADDQVDVDTVVETINGFGAATTKAQLRDMLKAALVVAQDDPKTTERFKSAAEAAAAKLPEVKQPTEKAPEQQEPAAEPDPQTLKQGEERASPGLLKSIRNLVETKGLTEAALNNITRGKALEKLSKSEAAKVLAAVSAS